MSGLLELLSMLDSWGSPSDVFTAITGFLTGIFAGPVGLAISRFIQTKLGHQNCMGTKKELKNNKEEKKDEEPKDESSAGAN